MDTDTRFGRTSPVLRYWLAHSEGFAVSGGAKGVVDRLVRNGDPHQPAALVVRRGRRRVRTIDAATVVAVFPDRKLLLVEKKKQRRRSGPPIRPLIRSVRWPRSVLSVRFAMTRVSPDHLQISWHRRTTSSRTSSERRISRAARTTSST